MKKVTSPLKHGNWTITIDVNKLNTEFLARHNRITDLTISACASNNPKLRLRWRLTLRNLKRDLDKSAHVEKIKGDKFWTLATEENRQEINKDILEISQGEPPDWFKERMKTTQE